MPKTDQQRLTDADREEEGRLFAEAILRTMGQPLLVLNGDLRVETANPAFCRAFDVDEAEAQGRLIYELGNGQWAIPELRELFETLLPNNGMVEDYRIEHEFGRNGRRVMVLNAHHMKRENRPDTILIEIADITRQEHAHALLEADKKYIEKIVDSSRDALLILDFELRVKSANETFFNTFRVDPSSAEGRMVYELGNGQWDIPELRKLLEDVLPDNHAFDNYVVEHDFDDLGHRTMVLNARRVDHLQLILLAIEDQTLVRRAERALRETRQLRRVLDNLFAFVGLLTPEGAVIEANQAPLEAAGIALADVQGRQFEDCYWWSYSAEVQAQLRDAIARAALGESSRYDVEIRVAGGRLITIDFMLAPLRDEAGAIIGLIPSAVDITERKRLTEERFQAFLDVSPDALVLVGSDRRISFVNGEAERLFGYARDELVGRPVEMLMPERYRARHIEYLENYFAKPHRRAMGGTLEITGLTRGRREIPLSVSLSAMMMSDETVAIAAARDITERKQAEEALRAAREGADRANALKSRFVAAASHDLRQPLQTIGLLGAVLAQTEMDETNKRAIQQLRNSVEVMANIVDTLLDIDRLDTGQVEPKIDTFPIERLLNRMRSQFGYLAVERGIELRMAPSSAIVRSDPHLLERLVTNLVSNGIKYTESGGRVLIGCRRRGGNLRVEVWDTGIGIPEPRLDNIFEEYYRAPPSGNRVRETGLGLGLAIVKRLSEILEHRVEVRSTPAGSVFSVELPLVQAGAGRGAPLAAHPRENRRAVLLVDDEAGPREGLRLLLELNGYMVQAVATSSQALAHVTQQSTPRLIIADYHLGEGIMGVQLIQSVREAAGWAIPAIVLTGDGSPETRREIENAGCRHELKPVKPEHLLKLVEQLVGYRSGTATSERAPVHPAPTQAPEPTASTGETVFVVEDDREVRGAVRSLLEGIGHNVEEFATAGSFLQALGAEARRGCVVLDVGLPDMSGLVVQERLKAEGRDLPVVVVTGRNEVSLAVHAMRAGAVDFLEKPFEADRLREAVDRALQQGTPHRVDERKSDNEPQSDIAIVDAARLASLTPREREVLALVAAGHPNKEVAHRLNLSPRTVENYRARGMHKLGIRSLAELVRLAIAAEAGGFQMLPR